MDIKTLPACAYETFTVIDFSDYEVLTSSSLKEDPIAAFNKNREQKKNKESENQIRFEEMDKLQ